jgi:outer membrane protein assembly factor BamB
VTALALILVAADFCWAQLGHKLAAETQLRRLGLTRAWTAQVDLNGARHHVVSGVLAGDRLFVLTSAGVVQSLSAETGRTLWAVRVGKPSYVCLGPAANTEFVALVNGSTLYVLDRKTGAMVMSHRIGGAPGAGPALADSYVFVPLVNGRIEGYPLHENGKPWYYQSSGQTMVTPLATNQSIVWSTSSGCLYVGSMSGKGRPVVRYRLEAADSFDAQTAYNQRTVFAISVAGELFALDQDTGHIEWKFVTGYPAYCPPAVVGQSVYVTSVQPALYSIDAATGALRWESPGVAQFAAAGKSHVFGIDAFGSLVVLDAATGSLAGRMQTGSATTALVNDQTDRLYLVSDSGLVQCLHEIGLTEPLRYKEEAPPAAPRSKDGPEAVPPPYEQPRQGPPRVEPVAPRPVENPFVPAAPGGDANPFGDFGASGERPPSGPARQPGRQPSASQPPAATTPPPATSPPAEENPFGLEGDSPFDFGK